MSGVIEIVKRFAIITRKVAGDGPYLKRIVVTNFVKHVLTNRTENVVTMGTKYIVTIGIKHLMALNRHWKRLNYISML